MKNFLRIIYYIMYDLLKVLYNLKKEKRFIILIPRFFSFLFKKVFILDKKQMKFFTQKIRDYSDANTVYEIFSEDFYSFNRIKNTNNIFKYYREILSQNLKPLIIDCGSNIGSSSSYFQKIFFESKILMIEPEIDNFNFSEKNVQNNNVVMINKAIDYKDRRLFLHVDVKDNRASNISSKGTVEVHSTSVDQLLKNHSKNCKPFLIKVDVEGYEETLFIDNYSWINEFKVIIIELHDWMLPEKSTSFNFLNALVETMKTNNKRDIIVSGENLISIRIDE